MKKKSFKKFSKPKASRTGSPSKQVKRPVPPQLMRGKVMSPFKKKAKKEPETGPMEMGKKFPGGMNPDEGSKEMY